MQPSDPLSERWRSISPLLVLAAILAAALALGFAPRGATQPLRDTWREALRPGLVGLGGTADWIGSRWTDFRCGDSKLPEAERKIAALNDRMRILQMQLLLACSNRAAGGGVEQLNQAPAAPDPSYSPPLLLSQAVSARVLGRQAQMFLSPRELLDVGKSNGAKSRALVIDDLAPSFSSSDAPLIDEGRDAAVQAGRLVLAGSRVWGKVAEAGPHTSTVQRVSDTGYRDLVQLARQGDGKLQFAGRGMLVGRGEPLCKIEMVESAESVTVGDLVFTVDDGVLDAPLLYGRIVRVERKASAPQWEIWMEPAVNGCSVPAHVAVLKMELNPARLAGAGSGL
jgi:hypothetical protein